MPFLHDNPTDCPGNLDFHFDDAGSRQHWQDVLRKERNPIHLSDLLGPPQSACGTLRSSSSGIWCQWLEIKFSTAIL